ncbi:pre-peptidase C-terminal domain-containing protein [Pseudoalteromonas ruthenica]|uniref:pre-peptidase C-terminal domain-containing protein n=1 Tax=Pseudoalteromonas ruthenica TaxID=151081 RepID=UPI00110AD037|nr:pre-peptidase C-terminal domain-containing protein [Pseudoalteromonas ruthenica]TMO90349.1 MAM protein [Pseudoalteromonas ruthenica]
MFKPTLIASALLSSTAVFAQGPLFEVSSQQMANSVNAAQANLSQLSGAQFQLTSNTASLSLPVDGAQVHFTRKNASLSASGNLIWQGENDNGDSVTLVQTAKGISGTVKTNGDVLKLKPVGAHGHQLRTLKPEQMPPEHQPGHVMPEGPLANQVNINNSPSIFAQPQAVADTQIDLLVVYTAKAAQLSGDIDALIDLAINETNQGYQNSGVNATVSLAHKAQVNYTEASSSGTDLNRLAGTNDGYMDEVHGLRDQYGADVVVLVNDVNGYCGQADAIGASASSAFAMVDYDCATGYYSFGHEIGHLQAARHNPENDPTNSPYAYGHGYQDPSSQWRTVMAYNCNSGCTRINYWSNPNKSYNGTAMGTTTRSDNTRVLNITSPTIANFRSGGTPPPLPNELENGQPISISGANGSETLYTFEVPAGASNISITSSGGSGDLDLYVKYGATASQNNYDCRPYENGNNESCTDTRSGTYSIMVHGYNAYSGATLVASYEQSGSDLPIEITESNLSGSQGQWQYFTVDVPAGASTVDVSTSGGSGDVDLYVRQGTQPTTSSYDCRPFRSGNNESCSEAAAAGTWHVGLRAYSNYSGVTLNISVQ